jgi:hypothetical protein
MGDLVGCLDQNLRAMTNKARKRHLPLIDRFRRKLDATFHHRLVDGRPVAVKPVDFCNHFHRPNTNQMIFERSVWQL